MKKIALITIIFFILCANATQAQSLRISNISFATSIEDRNPVGVDTSFASTVGTVFCYTHIKDAPADTKIAHVWYYKDEEKARINLDVQSKEWRTWSSKQILESWTGRWRVMIEDANGNVLSTRTFTVRN